MFVRVLIYGVLAIVPPAPLAGRITAFLSSEPNIILTNKTSITFSKRAAGRRNITNSLQNVHMTSEFKNPDSYKSILKPDMTKYTRVIR